MQRSEELNEEQRHVVTARIVHDHAAPRDAQSLAQHLRVLLRCEVMKKMRRRDDLECVIPKRKSQRVADHSPDAGAVSHVEEMIDFEIDADAKGGAGKRLQKIGGSSCYIENRARRTQCHSPKETVIDRNTPVISIEAAQVAQRALHVFARSVRLVEQLRFVNTFGSEHVVAGFLGCWVSRFLGCSVLPSNPETQQPSNSATQKLSNPATTPFSKP